MGIRLRTTMIYLLVAAMVGGFLLADQPGNRAQAQVAPVEGAYRVGFASTDPFDLWSANAAGQDRRNLTDTPDLDEVDPDFSPDGTQVAYTEYLPDPLQTRVMIANADGSNRRPLTTPSEVDRHEDPSWSPDGTMIALTHIQDFGEGSDSWIEIVRSADGSSVSRIPVPPSMFANDVQAAWSPDGTRIAFTRDTFTRPPQPNVTPESADRPVALGGDTLIDTMVSVPDLPAIPEIVFLIDTTGSMDTPIRDVKKNLPEVLDQIAEQRPAARFAVATYKDIDNLSDPKHRYDVPLKMSDATTVRTFLEDPESLPTGGGVDHAEDWFYALTQVPKEFPNHGGADRIVVVIGDAWSHEKCLEAPAVDPCSADPRYVIRSEVRSALVDARIRLVGVPVASSWTPIYGGLDYYHQATEFAAATNGTVLAQNAPPDTVAEAIRAALTSLPVTVTPQVVSCDPGLTLTADPEKQTVPGGTNAAFTLTAHVAASAVLGSRLHCEVQYWLDDEKFARTGYTQHVEITVTAPGPPMVAVDNVTVAATSRDGAVVNYPATATAPDGSPLTPTCQPASGTTFPIGSTLVTCTATDAGKTGTDTALITVFDSTAVRTGTRLWVADLASPTAPDAVTVTSQRDLTARLTQPCEPGDDQSPAWSPDSQSIVFDDGPAICVVGVTGDGARRPVTGGAVEGFQTPAWSPDGQAIVFADDPDGPSPKVWTVPAAGGTATVLLDPAGGAKQPAFQRQPDVRVDGAADPPAVELGTASTLRFTVTNQGPAPARAAALTVTLPPGLRLDSIATTAGTCAPAGQCTIGTIAPDATVTVTLRVTGTAEGQQVAVATVTSAPPDTNPGNNTARTAVQVQPGPVVPSGPPPTDRISPELVNRPTVKGGEFTVDKTVPTPNALTDPKIVRNPEVVLLVDDTGSMGPVIDSVKADLRKVIEKVHAVQPSTHFAVAAFRDEEDGPRLAFRVEQQPLAASTPAQVALLEAALDRLEGAGGGDTPEDWINALYQVASGAVTFTPDASRIVVLVGDAESHDPSIGHSLDATIAALTAQKVRVVAAPTGPGGLDSAGQASKIAEATNGIVMPPPPTPEQVADTIATGITSLPVPVTPVIACDAGLTLDLAPPGPVEATGGTVVTFVETVRVAATATVGTTLRCTVEFRLNGEPTVRPGYTQQVVVPVTEIVLTVNPGVAAQGTVARAIGSGFPPGATVRLTWSVGITQTPGLVTVRPDGTFDTQVLIYHHDPIGNRQLRAARVDGALFADVASQPILVVLRSLRPPLLAGR